MQIHSQDYAAAGWSTTLSDRRARQGGRRAALTAGAVAGLAVLLGGCGFQLRQAPALNFTTVQLNGFEPRSALGETLRQRLAESTTTRVVESLADAQVVLDVLTDTRERSVVASTSAAQVRELQLRSRFRFRLRSQDGRELIPPTEILLRRDMSYEESLALAKEQEAAVLYRAMQNDIAAQVLRRLAAVKAL